LNELDSPSPSSFARELYIAKLASMSRLDAKVEKLAIKMAHTLNYHLLADGKPVNRLAAAYIYLAAILGVSLLQIDLSRLAGVTEVTIRVISIIPTYL
jgi:transcription initiation factor TFIIB